MAQFQTADNAVYLTNEYVQMKTLWALFEDQRCDNTLFYAVYGALSILEMICDYGALYTLYLYSISWWIVLHNEEYKHQMKLAALTWSQEYNNPRFRAVVTAWCAFGIAILQYIYR